MAYSDGGTSKRNFFPMASFTSAFGSSLVEVFFPMSTRVLSVLRTSFGWERRRAMKGPRYSVLYIRNPLYTFERQGHFMRGNEDCVRR